MYLEGKKSNFCYSLYRKKSYFFIRKCPIISKNLRLLNFKNRSFLSGQEVIQIEPNSV